MLQSRGLQRVVTHSLENPSMCVFLQVDQRRKMSSASTVLWDALWM